MSVKLNPITYDRLKFLSAKSGYTMATLMRVAINDYCRALEGYYGKKELKK